MKLSVHRDVPSEQDADSAFEYLLDFRNAEEWDAGTVSCTRTSGDGGTGSTYRNVSKFLGRTVELTYTTGRIDRDAREFDIVGTTGSTTSEDTITVTKKGEGASVSYHAVFTFPTIFFPAYPLLKLAIKKLGDDTGKKLEESLRRTSAS